MRFTPRLLVIALTLGFASFGLNGCVQVAVTAGAGTVAYLRGELKGTVDQDLARTVKAAGQALESLKFIKISEKSDATVGVLTYRTADDKKVEVRIERVAERSSQVRIRVGLLGDESLSLLIWERIKREA